MIQAYEILFEAPDFNNLKASVDKRLKESLALTKINLVSESSLTVSSSTSLEALLSKVPDKEIILVSKDDLSVNGVEVGLLKAIIAPQINSEVINVKGLKFKEGDIVEDLESLDLGKSHFSKFNSKIKFQISKDGKFIISKNDVNQIDISFPDKVAVILVDDASNTSYDSNLNFAFSKTSDSSAQIEGSLTKRIDEVMPIDARNSLEITIQPQTDKSFEIQRGIDGTWTLRREADHSKSFTLPEDDKAIIKQLLKDYSDKSNKKGVTQQQKAENAEITKASLSDLKKQMDKSFKPVGLENLLKKENQSWAELEKTNTSPTSVKKCIDKILENAAKPEAGLSLEEEIKSIKSLSVKTKKGRLLFTAKPLD